MCKSFSRKIPRTISGECSHCSTKLVLPIVKKLSCEHAQVYELQCPRCGSIRACVRGEDLLVFESLRHFVYSQYQKLAGLHSGYVTHDDKNMTIVPFPKKVSFVH
jgi:DNA-directed RNA polymerase subunit RPC12/RpoP